MVYYTKAIYVHSRGAYTVGLRLSQSCNFCHISVRRHPKAISQAGVGHRDAYSTRLNIAGQRCFCYDVDPVIAFVVSVHLHWETTKSVSD